MSLLTDTVLANKDVIFQSNHCYAAYSGGVDSHVLLHLLAQLRDRFSDTFPPLHAVHINHQLHPDANQWVEHCQQACQQLNVPLIVTNVVVERDGGESLEAKARQARYRAFEEQLRMGDILLLAHHLDDQIETCLLHMLRGSGVLGMAAMVTERALGKGCLLRPLLDVSRATITNYARQHQLYWIEDPSNKDERHRRNGLRCQVLPAVEQHWPQYRQTLQRAIALNREAQQLNAELAALDCKRLGFDTTSESLSLVWLNQLSLPRQKNLLRYWLLKRNLPLPSVAQLQAVYENVMLARVDARPLVAWSGVDVHRFQDKLYMIAAQGDFDPAQAYTWNVDSPLTLKGAGRLVANRAIADGLVDYGELMVRFRQGGERCKPAGRNRSQTLKKLFQAYCVPPWLRDRVPLIYQGNTLVAVAGYWVCEGYQAAKNQAGWVINWKT